MADDSSNPAGNPGGYRPDDPRYGLSGQALQDYYLSRPPHFFIRALYKPDSLELREQAMAAHLAHVRAHHTQIHFAGPFMSSKMCLRVRNFLPETCGRSGPATV